MASENPLPDSSLPVKVSEPDLSAPPTLAEPASGHVAAMPGVEAGAAVEGKPTSDAPDTAVNGSTEPRAQEAPSDAPASAPSDPSADAAPTAATDDVAMTATEEAEKAPMEAATTETAADDVNGTPANKKASTEKRKSTASEPKGKKLNKKKSAAKITHLDAKPGDYYFARLKSYPPWPAILCDEDILPNTLLDNRPVTTKKADGTYNEAYADGGKKINERTYPVMFLHTNEFAWIPNTDLSDLDPETCKESAEKVKNKTLAAAYGVAAEAHDLDYFKSMLREHAIAMEEDELEKQQAREAKAKAKADKKKRKSEPKAKGAADEDVEMEDAGDAGEGKKSSKKRKKAADSDDEETEKPAKTPKTTKLKLTTKTPATAEKKEKKSAKKGDKRKSKPAVDEDEDMADAPEEEEPPKQLDPAAQKKAREREVLFLRHKLQKGFLSRDQAPQEEDMPQMSQYIKKLEDYEDLEVSIIRTTKINKVLKALIKLNTIPKDEEFAFRKRSVDLLGKWTKILGAEPQENDGKGEDEKDTAKSTPATNGVHEETADEKKEQQDEADAPEPQSATEQNKAPAAETKEEPKSAQPDPTPVAAEANPAEASAPEAAPFAEESKTEAPAPASAEPVTIEKAPESAAGAAEATEAVKATE